MDDIISEDSKRTTGKTAQKNNILAAKIVAETVRTTLGPKGMDKMLVDEAGDVIVTNDGVTILKEMDIQHPAAKMIVEIAKTQEDEVGDGTTTAVILAGELLKQAEFLIDKDIHPTIIAKGYRIALQRSLETLDQIAEDVTEETLITKIAQTAMTGKGSEANKDELSEIVIQAVHAAEEKEDIKIEKKIGEGKTELIEGVVLDKEKPHPSMPKNVSEGKIALLNAPLEVKDTEIDAKISITNPEQMQQFLDMEEKMIQSMILKIKESGATVVFNQKGIDDLAQHYLAQEGIYALRRVKKSDMESLAKATGASIVSNLKDLKSIDLGEASVSEKIVNDDKMTFVKNCQNPKTVTILVKGGTQHIADETKRALEDAIGDVITAVKSRKVVAGAGSTEMILAKDLSVYADTLSGREQLAVKAFSTALEIIPQTLAENAGLDPITVLTAIKSGSGWTGINVFTGETMNAWKEGVIEPLKIKTQALTSATEVSSMILRIDDIIAKKSE